MHEQRDALGREVQLIWKKATRSMSSGLERGAWD
jgi:hypothetical protein